MDAHIPVLLQETLDLLDIHDGGTYLDLTLGRAGHASEILKRIPHGLLIGFDQDPEAIAASTERLAKISTNFLTVRSNFSHLDEELGRLGVTSVDGILMDLGVSSPQFDEGERGFSYNKEAKLDMRMDPDNALTAYRVVNTYSERRLADLIARYGEDKDARRIARKIAEGRQLAPIETTTQLVEIIKSAKSPAELAKKGHPAKQTFQALRLEVNGEEQALMTALNEAPLRLSSKGRLAIISFMSLDDRLVKDRFRELTNIEGDRHGPDIRPEEIPTPDFILLTKKPIVPTERELLENHRSASAKLRGLQRR